MNAFRCWDITGGEDEEGGDRVEAFDAEHAAELYAEEQFSGCDPFDSIDVGVRQIEPSWEQYAQTFNVCAETEVVFRAYEQNPARAPAGEGGK